MNGKTSDYCWGKQPEIFVMFFSFLIPEAIKTLKCVEIKKLISLYRFNKLKYIAYAW